MAQYEIPIGDTFVTQLTITDVNGTAVDLTGATVTMTIIDRNGSTVHSEAVTSHTTPASGITTITIADDDTAAFLIGNYFYDVVNVMADGTTWTVEDGFVEVRL